MNRSIFKPIVFGVLFGTAAFFVPFLIIKMFFFFLVLGLIFRLFWWNGRSHYRMRYHMVYADKIRNMSDEEYAAFKNKAGHYHHCYHHGYCEEAKPKNESKQ